MADKLILPDAEMSDDTHKNISAPTPETLEGVKVFPGQAIGLAQQFSAGSLEIPQFTIEKAQTRGEIQRLRGAITQVDRELAALATSEDDEMPAEALAFVDVHRSIVTDPTLFEDTVNIIKEQLINAEWAIAKRLDRTRRDFEAIENEYLRSRVADIEQVVRRVQRVLTGRRSSASLLAADTLDDKLILVADDLDPADILLLRDRTDLDIVGIVLEAGSATSHAAILARSLEIPTVVGVKGALEAIASESTIIVDADRAIVELQPTAEGKRLARAQMRVTAEERSRLRKLKGTPAKTTDGVEITLMANIALPDDLRDVHRAGADGIGLFRTEFLYMNRTDLPSEDEQYEAYSRVIRSLKGKPVTIRTADIGGDKPLPREVMDQLDASPAEDINPALGLRALRFSFQYPEIFRTQLRAILRASLGGSTNILLPLITSPTEVALVRKYIAETQAELAERRIKYSKNIRLGGMVEVPAAVVMLPYLATKLDFFSIGTNDLVQYTLAADRSNASVSQYYEERHPAVLQLIARTIKVLRRANKPVSICGEMASRRDLAELFVGLGVKTLSMVSTRIPSVKERILSINAQTAQQVARSALRRHSPETTIKLLENRDAYHHAHNTHNELKGICTP